MFGLWKRVRELECDVGTIAKDMITNLADIELLNEKLFTVSDMFKDMSKRIESNNQQIALLKKQMTEVGHRISRSGF